MTTKQQVDNYLIFDMADVKFVWNVRRTAISAVAGGTDTLAVVKASPDEPAAELAVRALDAALGTGVVLRTGAGARREVISYRVGLYNPFTAEIATGNLPDTTTFGCPHPLALSSRGTTARLDIDGTTPVLTVEGEPLTPRELTFAALSRTAVPHI